MLHDRSIHQPVPVPEDIPEPSTQELTTACGHTLAVILALDTNTTPLKVTFDSPEKEPVTCVTADKDGEPVSVPRALQIYEEVPVITQALRAAFDAQVSQTVVLAAGEADLVTQIDTAVNEYAKAQDKEAVSVISLSSEEIAQARKDSHCFEIINVPMAAFLKAKELLGAQPALDRVLFLAADQVRIMPRHIFALEQRLNEHPESCGAYSWVAWLRRLPLLLTREFLEELPTSWRIQPREGSADRPLPNLPIQEVVFGEERIDASGSTPAAFEGFVAQHTLSALQAVRAVRAEQAAAKSDEATAKAPQPKPNDADAFLLDTARATLAQLDEAFSESDKDELTKWSAWGARNQADFPLLNDRAHKGSLVYLDSAATSQRAAQSLQAMEDFDKHENANVYRGGYDLSMKATFALNDARALVEKHLNADRRQTIYTANTSASVALAAQAWGYRNLNAGDIIALPMSEHHSNMLPWTIAAEQCGAEVVWIELDGAGRMDEASYAAALAKKPKLVAMAQISNVMGILNPIEKFAAQAHEAGARFFVDAAQSFPHIAIDVKTLGADFVAFSAHKAYGPMGIGGLWVSPEAFGEMDPVWAGGGTISHASLSSYYLRQGAIQYELGTPPISQAMGFGAAMEYLDELGMDAIEQHSRILTRYLVTGLHAIDGVTIWGDHDAPDGETGLVSVSLYCVPPAVVGSALGKLDVCVRSGGHCALPLHNSLGLAGTTRFSTAVHTTAEDIEAALVALRVCKHFYVD